MLAVNVLIVRLGYGMSMYIEYLGIIASGACLEYDLAFSGKVGQILWDTVIRTQ
jgi:hypothetical protein